jgi:hypothetical protein
MLMGGSHLFVAARRSVEPEGKQKKRFQRHRQSSTTAVCYFPPSFLPSFFFFNYLNFILSLRDVGYKETP